MYLRVLANISQNNLFFWYARCVIFHYPSQMGYWILFLIHTCTQVRNRQFTRIKTAGQEDRLDSQINWFSFPTLSWNEPRGMEAASWSYFHRHRPLKRSTGLWTFELSNLFPLRGDWSSFSLTQGLFNNLAALLLCKRQPVRLSALSAETILFPGRSLEKIPLYLNQ